MVARSSGSVLVQLTISSSRYLPDERGRNTYALTIAGSGRNTSPLRHVRVRYVADRQLLQVLMSLLRMQMISSLLVYI